ncbi:MAG: nicotinate (nicotinamide) nucleotide adenylyltransferase [Nitrospirae bacterium RIFOXYB2_FULL_43_5]|nr:MAG: nicotinate (nicotinamide) nucleotide adenylyltransferase [Nitrospirae bacterium GWF2_44_13]OGW32771.1 MAG: nicotinate (nicotinamide) nucleotide adenylyltransferase [Nitrospirae bacterium GWD2_44_7]OGW63265.1 MAG: nicotinate (nicotinamide) nucleotide adenylyltransferase [Nitrospirae bacterium RIFOXYA2_FULL_44_9]OGW73224.1 MAG: nicotinate (nicotinamide) nucleotide adenylyltransferase [Nitrospirae bacterium RIFOXYC2_FULL_44_7]OGW75758.1 MAG: nicotinate (nicotinamide) nucleotide adenylyltra
MKLGIFGGTFNPIHYGHLKAAEEVKEKLGLDRIIFVPSGNPPLKDKELADAKHRYKMVKLAISKNRSLAVSDIEYKKKDKSYSVDTIEKLRCIYPGARLYFIAGIDAFIDIPNWWQPERLVSLADFIVVSRPAIKFAGLASSPYLRINRGILKKLDDAKLQTCKTKLKSGRDLIMLHITPVETSATGIRKLIKRGKSIKYLLPEEVESYIITHKIYKS